MFYHFPPKHPKPSEPACSPSAAAHTQSNHNDAHIFPKMHFILWQINAIGRTNGITCVEVKLQAKYTIIQVNIAYYLFYNTQSIYYLYYIWLHVCVCMYIYFSIWHIMYYYLWLYSNNREHTINKRGSYVHALSGHSVWTRQICLSFVCLVFPAESDLDCRLFSRSVSSG